LSLRLLGKLDDELSCANSRFFRTTLYSDPRIAQELRENFVLHWSSERPVPVVTIDYGDGRKLCNTITGNSAHYLLDADGKPLDAVPGLYSPDAFLEQLANLKTLSAAYERYRHADPTYVAFYHRAQFDSVMARRQAELTPPQGDSSAAWAKLENTKGVV